MHYNKASNIYKKTENADITNGDTITVVKKVVTELIRSMNIVSENIGHKNIELKNKHFRKSLVLIYSLQTSLDFEKAEKFCSELFQIYEFCRKKLIDGYTKKFSDGIKKAVFWLEEIFFNNKGKCNTKKKID